MNISFSNPYIQAEPHTGDCCENGEPIKILVLQGKRCG